MQTIDLYAFDGETVLATMTNADPLAPPVSPQVIVWGTRAFSRNADGRYIQVTLVDQAMVLPASIPPPAIGATN